MIYSKSEFSPWQQPSFGAWLTCFIPPILLVPCLSVLMLSWFVTYFQGCFGLLFSSCLRGLMLFSSSKYKKTPIFSLAFPLCFVLVFLPCVKNPRYVITLVPHSNILFLEQERGDWRQNPNKPNKARTNSLPPKPCGFQSCISRDCVDKRGKVLFIKGRKLAAWITKIMPKKADERVNRRKKE